MVDKQRPLRAEHCCNRVQMSESSADCWLLCEVCVKSLMIDCLRSSSLLLRHCAYNGIHVVKSASESDSLPAWTWYSIAPYRHLLELLVQRLAAPLVQLLLFALLPTLLTGLVLLLVQRLLLLLSPDETLTELKRQGGSILRHVWVFKIKRDDEGHYTVYKARGCVDGSQQKHGFGYNETRDVEKHPSKL